MNMPASLVLVLGTSPAVFTETLYELERVGSYPRGIEKIDVITTSTGREKGKSILEEQIKRYVSEYSVLHRGGNLDMPDTQWLVPKNAKGVELADMTTSEESECAGTEILRVIHDLSKNRDSVILASIAGGRKTMSYYLGLVMSIYARPQDRLYHVLVPPELEANRNFYFPIVGDQSPIHLPELPFPRLRGFLEQKRPELYSETYSLHKLVDTANLALGPTLPAKFTLRVNTLTGLADIPSVDLEPIKLSTKQIRLFIKAIDGLTHIPEEISDVVKKSITKKNDSDPNTFSTELSKLNRHLRNAFGDRVKIRTVPATGGHVARYFLSEGMEVEII